jgi:hypothetical protein
VLAFLAARLVVVAASIHVDLGYPGPADLSRADSFNYLSIAAHGYILHPCPPACVVGVGLPWSGNSGWFPLYPLLIAPFSHLHEGAAAGFAIAALAQLAAFVVLWRAFLQDLPYRRSLPVLALVAVFPGAMYFAALFPMSLFVLLLLVGLWFLERDRVLGVTAVAFLAAATYPIGWTFAVVAAVTFRRRLRAAALPLLAAGSAILGVVVAQQVMTGHWNAYLLSQSGRGHGINNPWPTLTFAKAVVLSDLHHPSRHDLAQYPQTALVVVVVLVTAAALLWQLSRKRLQTIDAAAAGLVGLLWLTPLVVGGVSLYRTDAAILPAVILIRRLPGGVAAVLAVVAAPIAYWIDISFFQYLLA